MTGVVWCGVVWCGAVQCSALAEGVLVLQRVGRVSSRLSGAGAVGTERRGALAVPKHGRLNARQRQRRDELPKVFAALHLFCSLTQTYLYTLFDQLTCLVFTYNTAESFTLSSSLDNIIVQSNL